MKLNSYAKVLKMGPEEAAKSMAGPRAAEMKQKALHEISKLDVKIAEQESRIQHISAQYPISFDSLLEAQDTLALSERRKRQLTEAVRQLFPEGEK